EVRPAGLREGDRLCGHDVGQRAAEDHRATPVDPVGQLGLAQHRTAAWAAQALVRGGGDDVRVRHRVEVAGEDLAGNESGEVGHVHHEGGANLVCDFPHDAEVHLSGVRGVTAH